MYKHIDDIRQEFLSFFEKKKHQILPSSSLIPDHDHTLLFTNSGMTQFKNIFLGIEKPIFNRIATAQFCMRAGGKHNDLDNVGYTERHLTFFEMLGNFSFGDYFKNDAIHFAWEFLTDLNWLNLSKDRIWVTTHISDDESYDIWTKYIGISAHKIVKIGNKNSNFIDSDNFWQMGNIGPCGPCSEIFYDLENSNFQGISSNSGIKLDGNRYIEIWNLVFMQFNQQENGKLIELPMLSVDTGMGLERITAILQGVRSNYCVDVFKNLIVAISQSMQIKESVINNRSLYVISDHIRACSFLIKEGVMPSNEGRGYVLRRIIRRAIRHGKKIGVNDIFFYKLVLPLVTHMRFLADILKGYVELIEQVLFNEEKLFRNTLQKGLELLEKSLIQLKTGEILSGEKIFQLYATYGFPLELTKDICDERNIKIDELEFNQIMLKEKKYSKQVSKFFSTSNNIILPGNVFSTFVGYQYLSYQSKIIKLFHNNIEVHSVSENMKESLVILDVTPFYAESGGQIGDCGYLTSTSGVFKVVDTKKYGDTVIHIGVVSNGYISIGDQVFAKVDQIKRKNICLNHSATHLLHAALLKILGNHIVQKGSLINDKYLRFDFTHDKFMTTIQINDVERFVNQQIWNNLCITDEIMLKDVALKIGALFLSNIQYKEKVRVLSMGDFSIELCGGTHAKYTGEIGLFIILKEFGVGSGIRRIEAVTQNSALVLIQRKKTLVQSITQLMQSDDDNLLNILYEFKSRYNKLEKEIKNIKNTQEIQNSSLMINDVFCIKDIRVLIKRVNNKESKILFNIVSHLKYLIKSGIIVLINMKSSNAVHIVVTVTKDLIECDCINAVKFIRYIISHLGGKGGGNSDFAQININGMLIKSKIELTIQKLLNDFL